MSPASDVYLITGACGFLGERICRLLLEEEQGLAEIRLFDKKSKPELVQSLQASTSQTKVSMFEGDIRDSELLRRACRGVTLVVHTASIIDIVGAVDYSELHGVNVKGTQLLLEACIQENVASFVYTSSIEVAGPNPQGDPVINGDEDTPYPARLKFPYSRTKQEAEQLSLRAHGEPLRNGGRLATCILRPMYIYGDGCPFLILHMANGIRNGNALRDPERRAVVGGNFYFISDDTPPVSYSDFNHVLMSPLGFGIQEKLLLPYPLLFFLSFLMELLQWLLRPFLRYCPPLNRQLLIMVNTPFTFSYRKAQKDIGYTPRYSWEESHKRTTDWLATLLPQRERIKTH
ncbi:hypothetical protein ANANG_G00276110 [Anguilla anguilla]|uniref:3-beta hydroxysteroid dehydrogenase/isomerase domain-containing protein n=1 Tax=Anguilla anguilla TaxID=7936 RepID=A0A9D3LVJ3_ANGAN|nr:hypothetical protein ANANG_G00276110 [Anguilla anguilla]